MRWIQALAAQLGQRLRERVAGRELDIAVGADEQQARAASSRATNSSSSSDGVRPVQVVEHEHQRLVRAGVLRKVVERVEQPEAGLLGSSSGGGAGQVRQALAHLGDDLGDVGRARAQLGAQRLAGRARGRSRG